MNHSIHTRHVLPRIYCSTKYAKALPIALLALFLTIKAQAQSTVDSFNPGANARVRAMALQADGKLVVGGTFTTIGGGGTGTTPRNYIARLNPDGSVDTTFDPGADGQVEVLAIQDDGKILVGGGFTSLGGAAALVSGG